MDKNESIKNISEERYIEIKKIAYDYYERYNSLDKKERKEFLSKLPDLGSKLENELLVNTMLIPDTAELATSTQIQMQHILKEMVKNEDYITADNTRFKMVEFSFLNTRELIKQGKLKIMDQIKYPDDSISDKQYISLKEETIEFIDKFQDMSLSEKVKMINASCEQDISYQAQIQISTLLIPNDLLLIEQLRTASVTDIANYYRVPESVINFKIEEYNKQDTLMQIKNGELKTINSNRLWYKTSLNDDMVYKLWDQSIYESMTKTDIDKAHDSLSKMFEGYSKVAKK